MSCALILTEEPREICDMQCDVAEAVSGECPLQHSGGVGRAKPAGDRAQVQWGEKPGQ